MAGHDLEEVDLLIPLPLANLFDLQESRKEEEAAADTETATAADVVPDESAAPAADSLQAAGVPADADQSRTILILDDNAQERQQFQELLTVAGVNPVAAALDADLKKMLDQGTVLAVLVGVESADEQELSLCRKIQAHATGAVPIILCARQWTRTGVLKALKSGARDILLKPCPPDELTAKVLKLMNAA
jgi:PleD family two-component response regulator